MPFRIVILAALIIASVQPGLTKPLPRVEAVGFCKPYTWLFGGWVAPPRAPLLADINGDGYADFLYCTPDERFIDVSLNGRGWKPMRGQRLISNIPQGIRSWCAGRFGGKTVDLVILGKEGGLYLARSAAGGSYPELKSIALPLGPAPTPDNRHPIPGATSRAWVFAGRARKDGPEQIAIVSGNGSVQFVDETGRRLAEWQLEGPVLDAAAGDVRGDGTAVLAIRSGGKVRLYPFGARPSCIATVNAPAGQQALALGDIDGDRRADLLVNGRVFLAPGFRQSVAVPGWEKFDRPVIALLADVAGHGRCDLVVQHQGPDHFGSMEADCDLYVSYRREDPDWDCDGVSNTEEARLGSDPLDRCTSHDGLPDGWKVHGFAGVDLKGMGCSPLHKDVLVMNLLYDNVPVDQVEKYMKERVVPFFALIPYTNLDGKQGFAVHWITQTPPVDTKASAGKPWWQLSGERLPADRIGLYHWMLVSGMGGGGQSNELADSGSTGMGSWIHEFGHQLGLSHSGKWSKWAPTYTSLMNYSYSYGFEGDGAKVHFSTGEFAGTILNESRLPGRLPYPIERLRFLAGPPYHFHLKADGATGTFVDWGWSGVFADRPVRANITYGYAVGGGERLQPSGKQPFNYDGPYELQTDFQASLAEHRGKLCMATAVRPPVEPNAPRPAHSRLVLQTYQGARRWSDPATVATETTGEPCVASDGADLYLFYPTDRGIMYRYGRPDALGEPHPLSDTRGASVCAVAMNGRLYAFTYRGPDREITWRTVQRNSVGAETPLGIRSTIPPGAALDTITGDLLLGGAEPFKGQPYRWRLHRLRWDTAAGRFALRSSRFVGGENAGWAGDRRPNLIFRAGPEYGPSGRIFWIATGTRPSPGAASGFYVAQTIGYPDVNDGWLLWRYYDEWTNTRSGVAAAWFDNDIVLATTWASGTAGGDGGVFCAYNGTAVSDVDMADFDDVAHMAGFGMARSIATLAAMPTAGSGGR